MPACSVDRSPCSPTSSAQLELIRRGGASARRTRACGLPRLDPDHRCRASLPLGHQHPGGIEFLRCGGKVALPDACLARRMDSSFCSPKILHFLVLCREPARLRSKTRSIPPLLSPFLSVHARPYGRNELL
jgi:hypothetical protein